MNTLRSLPLFVLASTFLCSAAALAQQAAPAVRIVDKIDESNLVTLKGNTHPAAIAKNDRGAVSASLPMTDLILVLSRSPEQQAAFDAFVSNEYDTGSPNYHQWLTPAQIGAQFGPAQADIASITGWLSSHGFTVKQVAPDGMTIRFSGTAAQVESAFHTEIHNLSVNGKPHYANMSDPQIPAALAPVIVGVKALHNFLPQPQHRMGSQVRFNRQEGKWQRIASPTASSSAQAGPKPSSSALSGASRPALNPHPLFGINGEAGTDNAYLEEDVSPWDFATIYNVIPAWNAGYTGANETIAIAGTSLIAQSSVGSQTYSGPGSQVSQSGSDVATFRSAFDLPAITGFQQIDTKDGPAATECTSTSPYSLCGIGDLEENSLDVEWSGAVAKGASIVLVVTGQNTAGTVDTVYDSAQYIVQYETARILSLSYGECELFQGTAENVAFYDLWQSAAAEGISVFVATGDSGSPSCDDGGDAEGNPYVAQYGLSVSGLAATPYNVAVGGTDFSWCQPYYNSSGDYEGCPTSSTSQGSPAYWATSNNATTGESALNYVPEIPWNDSCENPIWARYIETLLSAGGADSYYGINPTTPEEACNISYEGWSQIDGLYEEEYGFNPVFEYFVDTVGGSGGASNCVVNSTNPDSTTVGACSTGATTTGTANGSIPLTNDGWPSPSWQSGSGVTGTSALTTRAIPDVSFFAGDGSLASATLICVSSLGPCTYPSSTSNSTQDDELEAQEVGGTSVGTPEMAGVMALINQKAGAPQGLPNPGLYKLASQQNYANCSAETVTNSNINCYFQSIDNGPSGYSNAQTNAMPCNLTGTPEGGDSGGEYEGIASPNCAAINSGDTIGTLVSSGTTPAYNAAAGYNLATGLGSLNVYNVVNAWVSDAGTNSATLNVTLNPSNGQISAGGSLTLTISVSGGNGTPTGSITVSGGGYNATQALSGGGAMITIPPNSLAVGSDTLTVTYSGDATYASTSKTESVTVAAITPTIQVSAPASDNVLNPVYVTVTVSGPTGAATPTGTVSLDNSTAVSLSSTGIVSFTIPANTLAVGTDTLTADYNSNSSTYVSGTGSAQITIVNTSTLTPKITVTPSPTSIDTGESVSVTVTVTGSGPPPTGSVTLSGGAYSSTPTVLTGGSATFTIPGNSLTAGTPTLTATYSGDVNYLNGSATNNGNLTVTESTLPSSPLTAGTPSPSTVTPPGTATVTITGNPSTTFYTGTITFGSSSCALMTPFPSGANTSVLPTCTGSGTITYTNGTPSGNGTATVTTYSVTTSAMIRPKFGNGKGWLGASSGAVLALVFFFGIPARRRSWRKMLCILAAFIALGVLSSCGGGSSGITTTTTSTTAGSYTFTLTGTASPAVPTAPSTTFTIMVN